MPETIIIATTASDYKAFAGLAREFVEWCRSRYDHEKWFVDAAFSHPSLETELKGCDSCVSPCLPKSASEC